MAIKVCLDAGHYGKYNRSPAVSSYYESDMTWKLHNYLKKELEALAAADSVVIPTQLHYLSAKGLELLLRSVSKVKRQINPKLRIDGILMTMVMPRTNISKEITATVKSAYGQKIKVFDAEIPHSIRAVEATAEGKSIFAYDKSGKVATAYDQFAKEVAEIGEKQRRQNRADRIR